MINSKVLLKPQLVRQFILLDQRRTSIYERYKHGPSPLSNPPPNYAQALREFFSPKIFEYIKGELQLVKNFFTKPHIGKGVERCKLVIFEHFDSDKFLTQWKAVNDSDSYNGFSQCMITRSPEGHGLFKGLLDTRIPDDGLTKVSGFCGMVGPHRARTKWIELDPHYNWEEYNCVELKFRGDGRKYNFIVSTSSARDNMTYYDVYSFPLYTRGGPFWQTVRIPFSKLVFSFKGMIQDHQDAITLTHIKFVGVTIQDSIPGPFRFEIDYMGLLYQERGFEEDVAYEGYMLPHMKQRDIGIATDPPLG